jgi:Glycosyl transferases group 1
MVEALACGTPVIAFPEGAAAEIVIDGENGMLVADEAEMARAAARVGSIDPVRCRASVAERYDVSLTAAGYEDVYRRAIAADRLRATSRAPETTRQQPARGSTPQHKLMSAQATRREHRPDETAKRAGS